MDSLNIQETNNKETKKKKRKHVSTPNESENDISSKRSKRKHKKKCKKKHKYAKDKKHKKDKHMKSSCNSNEEDSIGPDIPNDFLNKAQSMAPMSKDEWEKKQNMIRREYDEETGRTRYLQHVFISYASY